MTYKLCGILKVTLQSYRLRPCSPANKCPVSSLAMLAYYFTLTFSDEVGCSHIRRERILMRPSPLRLSCSGYGFSGSDPAGEMLSTDTESAPVPFAVAVLLSKSCIWPETLHFPRYPRTCHPGSPCFDRAASLYGALCVGFLILISVVLIRSRL